MKQHLALNFLMSKAWALDQAMLEVMGGLAARDLADLDLSTLPGLADHLGPVALEGKGGRAVSPGMEIRDGGVALVHVNGVISRYATMFHAICGGTSTQMLAKDFNAAMDNPAVRSVVLYINSPGGEADGIHELAEMIYQARGRKPIVAYIGGAGCSAAFWVATAADEVVIDATARLGSIGTVMTFRTRKKSDTDQTEVLEIVSSQSPNKRLDPASEEGRKAYQSELDNLADIFIDRVARNMGVSRETVLNDFGKGGVLIGQRAVDVGMAHRLGSLEGVISELKQGKRNTMSKENKTGAAGESGQVLVLGLPGVSAGAMAADVIAAITAERPDVIEAIKAEQVPALALDHAEEIAKACADAGIPALSASLLTGGLTKASADERITQAKALKDTLSAAGLSASFDSLLACINDPIKMVGQAIHEVQASADESGTGSRVIRESAEQKGPELNAKDIYKNRR
jgi:capsid assembly protease